MKKQMNSDVIKRDRTILQLQQQLPPQIQGLWLQDTDDAPQSILSVATPQSSFRTTKVPCSPRSFGPPVPLGAQSMDQYGLEPVVGVRSQKQFPSPGGSLRSVSQGGSITASPWTAAPSKKPSGPMRRSNYTPSFLVDGAKSPGYKPTFNSPRSPHRCITAPVGSLPLSFMSSSRSGDTFGSPVQHRRQCVHSESRLLHDKKERRLMLGAHTFT